MQLLKDIWRPLIVLKPLAEIIAAGTIEGAELRWLPSPGPLRYLADPFGYWRDGQLYVFVETFDYRTAIGAIDVLVYDARYRLIEQRPVLRKPWHLSYPIVFDGEGETWMLPEASASGALTLYRAIDFPQRWEAAHDIALDAVAIDATPLFHDGLWWLFYTPAGSPAERLSVLHVAFAERLAGPWTTHPGNPVRIDAAGARPGGTPIAIDGRIVLPVQDCSITYGGAIRLLTIDQLDPATFSASPGERLEAPQDATPFVDGCHTLAGAGAVTLIDFKQRQFSLNGLSMRPRREIRKLLDRRDR